MHVLSFEDIVERTDARTLARGRAYARQERVEALRRARGELRAEVVGTQTYHVRIGDGSWWCDCPVGVTGALCKHCVAVVIVADTEPHPSPTRDGGPVSTDPADVWLESLDATALRALVREAATEAPGVADLVARAYITATDDIAALRAQVEDALKPRRQFYEYRQANRYAAEAEPVVRLLVERASRPSPQLLAVVERALTLTVRTIVRSDDSSGTQGDQVRCLLDLHAQVADTLGAALETRARRRLATWLHKFVFSGLQDYFEIAVDQYADALGAEGVAEYRRLLDWTAEAIGEEAVAVRYARGRLAVLDRDPVAIVAVVGQGLAMQYQAVAVVEALDDAGLHDLAVEHAALGLRLPHSHQAGELVQRLVDDATARGDTDGVLGLRRAAFTRDPSSTTLTTYRTAAEATGSWAGEARAAEDVLARARPWEWLGVLLHDKRDDEAWTFAVEHPDAAKGHWERLCARRAETVPAETVPHYRRMITETLATTGRASYLAAARLLVRLRAVCEVTGTTAEFVEFMATTVETNRRRPTCIDELVRAGLIRRDQSIVEV